MAAINTAGIKTSNFIFHENNQKEYFIENESTFFMNKRGSSEGGRQ